MRNSKWLPRLAWVLLLGGFCYAASNAFLSPVSRWAVDGSKDFPERITRQQAAGAMNTLARQYEDHLRSTIIPAIIMLAGGIMGLAARPDENVS